MDMGLLPHGGRLLGGSHAAHVIGSWWPGLARCPWPLIGGIAQWWVQCWGQAGAMLLPHLWATGPGEPPFLGELGGCGRACHGLGARLLSCQQHPQLCGEPPAPPWLPPPFPSCLAVL